MPAQKKHSSVRRRANKASTAAVLEEVPDGEIAVPELPKRYDADGVEMSWRPETLDWWDDVWASPMSNEYLDADVHGLFRLAVLVDNYWRDPNAKSHAEVRLAQKDYGLTPYDRRRLEWTIEATKKAKAGNRGPESPSAGAQQPKPTDDPRLALVK